jgi:hypothetical protein
MGVFNHQDCAFVNHIVSLVKLRYRCHIDGVFQFQAMRYFSFLSNLRDDEGYLFIRLILFASLSQQSKKNCNLFCFMA